MSSANPLKIASDRYLSQRPHYERLVKAVSEIADRSCRTRGLKCVVSGRAKEHASLVKQILRTSQSYEHVQDKAGVRIIPLYPDDKGRLVDLVHETFTMSWQQDFEASPADGRFGYRGHHFTIALRDADKKCHPEEVADLTAELQVQTLGANIWENVHQDLVDPNRSDFDVPTQRAIGRFSAILELMDASIGELRSALLCGPSDDTTKTIEILKKDHLRINGQPFDAELTREIVGALSPLIGDLGTFSPKYNAFVAAQEPKISYVLQAFRGDPQALLMTQPESLLIFYFLERHMVSGLHEYWPETISFDALEALNTAWVK